MSIGGGGIICFLLALPFQEIKIVVVPKGDLNINMDTAQREKKIVQTSFVGIGTNVALVVFKAIIGFMTNSIAIILDAVNNLTDALSSLITIIGTKLAGKEPDKKHPYGYGRTEYISALLISLLILYAGVTSMVESIKKAITPGESDYTVISLVIIGVAVLAKVFLGIYFEIMGKKTGSESLKASGKDALFDSLISLSTLIAALVALYAHVSIEAYLGIVIALFILKSGFESLFSTMGDIVGKREDVELTKAIRKTVESFPGVLGAYDLTLHDYGPERKVGDVHLEVDENMNVGDLDKLENQITIAVLQKHKVLLTGISVYAVATHDPETVKLRDGMYGIVKKHPEIKNVHAFHYYKEKNLIRFDMVISFDVKNRKALYQKICDEVKEAYPQYQYYLVLDSDVSD